MKKVTIKVKTFSGYKLIDIIDLYHKIGRHLEKTKQGFCFLNGMIVDRGKCEKYGYKYN